jgi:hypothetical protein
MTLNWSTYNALPVLRSYSAALKHFNLVQPIRGDADGTKPAGRRDQKWLSIYMRDDKAVCIGSTWHKGQGRALLEYHPDGRVVIGMQISASCRERILRIAGLNINRHYNEDWVHAVAHVDGEEVIGQYPLKLGYNKPRKAMFILGENQTPIYLNPTPVYKHTMNRQEKAKLTKQYKPFLQYVEAMSKLSADDTYRYSPWSGESKDNPRLPQLEHKERAALGIPNNHVYYRYGSDEDTQAKFLTLVDSYEPDDWYKAMMWLSNGYWRKLVSEAKTDMMHVVHQQHRDVLFTKERVAAGKCVQDRYGRYFR